MDNVQVAAEGRELPDNLGDPVLGGGQGLLGLQANSVGADADAGCVVDKSAGDDLSRLAENDLGHLAGSDLGHLAGKLIHVANVDACLELLGVVGYNGSRKKSDGDETDVGLTVGIGIGIGIRIKIGARGGGCRVELAITEDKPALVNGGGTVVAATEVADTKLDDRARLVRKAKHGELGELWRVVRHGDRVGKRMSALKAVCVCSAIHDPSSLLVSGGWRMEDGEKGSKDSRDNRPRT